MKTVSVALVVCLNVGVDPPDVVKIQPCARLEAWIGMKFCGTFVDFYVINYVCRSLDIIAGKSD